LLSANLNSRESIKRGETIKLEEPNLLGQPFWKQALRLKLHSGLKSIESLRYDIKTKPSEKKQLDMATMQIKKSLSMLQDEKNPLIQEQLLNLKYTKDAIYTVKATVNRITKVILANSFVEAWRKLIQHKEAGKKQSEMVTQRNSPTSIYSRVKSNFLFSKNS
jgi:hypothetical protein